MTKTNFIRSRLASRTPECLRKVVRMVEHYAKRHLEWFNVLREMSGTEMRDKFIIGGSVFLAPITSLRRLDGFEPPLTLSDLDIKVKGVGRFKLRSGTDDIIHVLSAREPAVRNVIESLLQSGDVFIDAGANIGFYSVLAQKLVGATGQVIAFEMMPQTASILRDHVAINLLSSTRIVENALSDTDGSVVVATSNVLKFGQASICEVSSGDAERSMRYEVKTVTMDQVLSAVGEIALIKMDLEGAEYAALSGARMVLQRTRAIVFENNTDDQRIVNLLDSLDFAVESLDGNNYLGRRKLGGEHALSY